MRKTPRWILALALISAVAFAAAGLQAVALMVASWSIPADATVKTVNLQVYQDVGMQIELHSINWTLVAPVGPMDPGASKTVTVWLYSIGNAEQSLSMTTGNYSPDTAEQYMTVSWNKEGQTLQPRTVTPALISLSVASNVQNVTDFSFEITLIASG